jgi:hypothetical protein
LRNPAGADVHGEPVSARAGTGRLPVDARAFAVPRRHVYMSRSQMPPRGAWDLQRRLEETPYGRAAITLLLLVTLTCIVVTNLPESQLRRSLSKTAQDYLNATGLDQNWGVFAPDPRREAIAAEARITYADGTTETWRPPHRGALIGGYSDYRWRKLEENMVTGRLLPAMLEDAARWVVRKQSADDQRAIDAGFIKRTAPLAPPGPEAGAPLRYAESQFYNFAVPQQPQGGNP